MIREAKPLDALVILDLAERYVEEAGEYSGLAYDAEYAVGNLMYSLNDDRQLFIVSVNGDKEVVGMLWAMCAPILPWSPECIAVDQIVYVRPEYRGTKHGIQLLREYELWAKERGAVEVRLSIASGVHEEKTAKLYNKLGYSHLGSQHRRKL